jgi:transcriptional regulator with XRE-family HTH domain
MDEIRRIFGDNVSRLRKAKGWDQPELADRLSVKRAYVSHIETGRVGFTADSLAKVAEVFGVEPSELLRPKDDTPKEKPLHKPAFVPIGDSISEAAVFLSRFGNLSPEARYAAQVFVHNLLVEDSIEAAVEQTLANFGNQRKPSESEP